MRWPIGKTEDGRQKRNGRQQREILEPAANLGFQGFA
jgi:hypothetical protein